MIIRSRAPLRLGLAGGGTDISPFCDKYGGAVLNATIDLYAYSTIQENSSGLVRFKASDLNIVCEEKASSYLPTDDGVLKIHKGIYNRVVKDFNKGRPLSLSMTTYCDAPAGSGLGSSSTLAVSILTSYVEWLNLPLGEYEIAHLAYDIERNDLKLLGGKQDQYAATFGGFNFMEFYGDDHVIVNPLRIKPWIISELESSLVLYYTGTSRESAHIIEVQRDNVTKEKTKSIDAMQSLKHQATKMKEYILKGDLRRFAECMEESWQSKKQTAETITNKEIERIYDLAKSAGALAGKVSGAGGGGFMMFLVEPEKRMDVIQALKLETGQMISCHFTKQGSMSWRI